MRRWLYHASFCNPQGDHSVQSERQLFDLDQKSPGGPPVCELVVVGLCSREVLLAKWKLALPFPPFADGSCSIAAVTCPRSVLCLASPCPAWALRLHIHNWHPSLPGLPLPPSSCKSSLSGPQ